MEINKKIRQGFNFNLFLTGVHNTKEGNPTSTIFINICIVQSLQDTIYYNFLYSCYFSACAKFLAAIAAQ